MTEWEGLEVMFVGTGESKRDKLGEDMTHRCTHRWRMNTQRVIHLISTYKCTHSFSPDKLISKCSPGKLRPPQTSAVYPLLSSAVHQKLKIKLVCESSWQFHYRKKDVIGFPKAMYFSQLPLPAATFSYETQSNSFWKGHRILCWLVSWLAIGFVQSGCKHDKAFVSCEVEWWQP